MSGTAPLLLGTIAGYGLGWLTWWLSGRLVAGYRNEAGASVDAAHPKAAGDGSVPGGPMLVPVLMAVWGGYVGWQVTSLDVAVSALVVSTLLLCLALVDFKARRLPNPLVLSLFGWSVVQSLWLGRPTPAMVVVGAVVAGGIFLLLALVGRGELGLGDVKLEAAIGALVGFPAVLLAMLAGVIAGGIAAVFLLVTRRAGRKDPMAYGPYLAFGAWLILVQLWGLWPGK